MKNNILSIIAVSVILVACFWLGIIFSYYLLMPPIIERRARDLNLMQYSAEKDKFVAKDSLSIGADDLYYLQYGNLDGY